MFFSQQDISYNLFSIVFMIFAFTERNNKLMEDVYRFKEADSKSIANQQQLQQQLILLEKVNHRLYYTPTTVIAFKTMLSWLSTETSRTNALFQM